MFGLGTAFGTFKGVLHEAHGLYFFSWGTWNNAQRQFSRV